MSRARRCEAADCEAELPPRSRALFCGLHEHDWVAAGEVPLEASVVSGAVRRAGVRIEEETWIVVRDVYCASCRQPYHLVKDEPCWPMDTVLRGGPMGVRKRRDDVEELAERP